MGIAIKFQYVNTFTFRLGNIFLERFALDFFVGLGLLLIGLFDRLQCVLVQYFMADIVPKFLELIVDFRDMNFTLVFALASVA